MSSVTNMSICFICNAFNQDIGAWNVSSVTNMSVCLICNAFNQDIGAWDVSSVTNMGICFMMQPHLIKTLVLGM